MSLCSTNLIETAIIYKYDVIATAIGAFLLFFYWLPAVTSMRWAFDPPFFVRYKYFRKLASLHRQFFVLWLSFALAFGSIPGLIKLSFKFNTYCNVPASLFDLVIFYWAFGAFAVCHSLLQMQKLYFRLDNSIVVALEGDNKLHVHLKRKSKVPIREKSVTRLIKDLNKHVTLFRRNGISNTVVLDSWLFVRNQSADETTKLLRSLIYFEDLSIKRKLIIRNKDRYRIFKIIRWKFVRIGRLVKNLPSIYCTLKKITAGQYFYTGTINDVPITNETDEIIRELKSHNENIQIEARPVRRISFVILMTLVFRHPRIGENIIPFTAGIEIK